MKRNSIGRALLCLTLLSWSACGSGTTTTLIVAGSDRPIALSPGLSSLSEDGSVTIVLTGTDNQDDETELSVDVTVLPANGTLDVEAGLAPLSVTYTPDAGFAGVDSLKFVVFDTELNSSQAASADFFVNGVNDPPTAGDDSASTPEDAAITLNVLANDTDPDDTLLTVQSTTGPTSGTVEINGNGTITYTPDENFSGGDSFTYMVRDPSGDTDMGTVTLTVTSANDAPTAADDAAGATEGGGPVLIDVLANDTDVDAGDTKTLLSVNQPPNGSTVLSAGQVQYTPDTDFNGTETFTYLMRDALGSTDTGTVTVAVSAVNDAPVAGDDTSGLSTDSVTPLTIGVLANDTDVDDLPGALSVTSVTAPSPGGAAVINPDDTITFTPIHPSGSPVTFSYTVKDPSGASDTGSVSVTVTPGTAVSITSFTATPDTIGEGGSTDLDWAANAATSCALQAGATTIATGTSGSITQSPAATTLYTLTCQGPAGPVTEERIVTVIPASTGVSITVFFATLTTINAGGSSLLVWSVQNATGCTLDEGIGAVSATGSSLPVSPAATTTYTLSCTDGSDTVNQDVTVTVNPDTDGDGVSDAAETAYGSLTNDTDSDNDGLLDGVENADKDGTADAGETSAILIDTDSDGLCDGALVVGLCYDSEQRQVTNPLLADTDGDGVGDGSEFLYPTDPLAQDTDGDTLPDGDENANGDSLWDGTETNAANPDTDADGVNDNIEYAYAGTNGPSSPIDEDSDDDNLTDGEENPNVDTVVDLGETDATDPDSDDDGLCDAPRSDNDGNGIDPADPCTGRWFVDAGGPTFGDGISWTNAFPEIYQAAAVAQPGDEIWVADGFYGAQGDNIQPYVLNMPADTSWYGGFEGGETTLEPRNYGTSVLNGGSDFDGSDLGSLTTGADHVVVAASGTRLDGFTVINGAPTDQGGGNGFGGGLYAVNAAGVTIANCTFFNNVALTSGGAIYASNSGLTLTDTEINVNRAFNQNGGGIFIGTGSTVTITDGNISSNESSWAGGGIYSLNSTLSLTDTAVENNSTGTDGGGGVYYEGPAALNVVNTVFENNLTFGAGGGLSLSSALPTMHSFSSTIFLGNAGSLGGGLFVDNTTATLLDMTFYGNGGLTGGAIYAGSSTLSLENSRFLQNQANDFFTNGHPEGSGGGLYNSASALTLINAVFFGNYASNNGGAVSETDAQTVITNASFFSNSANLEGGAFYSGLDSGPASLDVTNSVFWGDAVLLSGNEIVANGFSPAVTFTCIADGYAGVGNINLNPTADNPFIFTVDNELFLKHAGLDGEAASTACVDSGDEAIAAGFGFAWYDLTTRSDSGLDADGPGTNDIDRGFHYPPFTRIVEFAANPPEGINSGDSATLSWEISPNATNCQIDNGVGAASVPTGNTLVSPTATTTYTLACDGVDGPVSADTTVFVDPARILSFTATPNPVNFGDPVDVDWTTENAVSCEFYDSENGVFPAAIPSGTYSSTPTTDVTYSLNCTGVEVGDYAEINVIVNPPVSISFFYADSGSITYGDLDFLNWEAFNAAACILDDGTGPMIVGPSFSGYSVGPAEDTTYTLTCQGILGPVSEFTDILVNGDPDFDNIQAVDELAYGSNPFDSDSDDDGLTDDFENFDLDGLFEPLNFELNAIDPDTDDDLLCDYQRFDNEFGDGINPPDPCDAVDFEDTYFSGPPTDPLDPDSDDDGLRDGVEIIWGSNPTADTDSDDDSLTDGQEDATDDGVLDAGETSPVDPDTNGDGFCDGPRTDNESPPDGIIPFDPCTGQQVVYVDDTAAGANNGSNWADAYTTLPVPAQLSAGQQVWVAEGTYKAGSATATVLTMADGVEYYGGFVGTEGSVAERSDPFANPAILSGDQDDSGTFTADDSYHVVVAASNARLDGFAVTAGNAAGVSPNDAGGGIYNSLTLNLTLENLIVTGNNAAAQGSGMFNDASGLTVSRVEFTGNSGARAFHNASGLSQFNTVLFSGNTAGAFFNMGDPAFVNALFSGNTAPAGGGAFRSLSGSPSFSNATFTGNSAPSSFGGALAVSGGNASLVNVTFSGNEAAADGGALYANGGTVTLTNATFSANAADSDDDGTGDGGGVSEGGGTITVTNSVFWGNVDKSGADTASDVSGTATTANSCSETDLGLGNQQIFSDPFIPAASGELFLDQGSACIDLGDDAAADAAFSTTPYDWRNLTTAMAPSPLDEDTTPGSGGDVDAGRHYLPTHNRVNTFTVLTTNIVAWETRGASRCVLEAVGFPDYELLENEIEEGSHDAGYGSGTTVTIRCTGQPFEAVASVTIGADTDGDSLPDDVEDANGNTLVDAGESDPNNVDTDGDGLCDGDVLVAPCTGNEFYQGGSPADVDSDDDSLCDGSITVPPCTGNELAFGGNPNDPDTNDDGVCDGDRVDNEVPPDGIDPPDGCVEGPFVVSSDPSEGTAGVPLGKNVRIVFSEPMDHTTTEAAVTLFDVFGLSVPMEFFWSPDDTILTFSVDTTAPAGAETDDLLEEDAPYEIYVDPSAQTQGAENLAASYSAFFSTAADATRPLLNYTAPDIFYSAFDGFDGSTLVFNFNEDMNVGSGRVFLESLNDARDDQVDGFGSPPNPGDGITLEWLGPREIQLTFSPALDPRAGYSLELQGVQDVAGNWFEPEQEDFSLITLDTSGETVAPEILATYPADSATGVSRETGIFIALSEYVSPDILSLIQITGSGTTTFNLEYGVFAGPVILIIPNDSWPADEAIEITVPSGPFGVKDTAGNPLGADYVFSFTTTNSSNSGGMIVNPATSHPDFLASGTADVSASTLSAWFDFIDPAAPPPPPAARYLNRATLDSSDVSLVETVTGAPVKGFEVETEDGGRLSIDTFPNFRCPGLEPSTSYTLTLTSSLQDSQGIAMSPHAVDFTTASSAGGSRPRLFGPGDFEMITTSGGLLAKFQIRPEDDDGDVLTVDADDSPDTAFGVALGPDPQDPGSFIYESAGPEADLSTVGDHLMTYAIDDGSHVVTPSFHWYRFDSGQLPALTPQTDEDGIEPGIQITDQTPTLAWTGAPTTAQGLWVQLLDGTETQVFYSVLLPATTSGSVTVPGDQALPNDCGGTPCEYLWRIILIRIGDGTAFRDEPTGMASSDADVFFVMP
ncbi:MAG: tandem-95 repeat protein [Bdellovibrionota bacterium]